jgi:hypothetical protein
LQTGGRDVEYFIERELAAGLAKCAATGKSVEIDAELVSTAAAQLSAGQNN